MVPSSHWQAWIDTLLKCRFDLILWFLNRAVFVLHLCSFSHEVMDIFKFQTTLRKQSFFLLFFIGKKFYSTMLWKNVEKGTYFLWCFRFDHEVHIQVDRSCIRSLPSAQTGLWEGLMVWGSHWINCAWPVTARSPLPACRPLFKLHVIPMAMQFTSTCPLHKVKTRPRKGYNMMIYFLTNYESFGDLF